MRNHPSHFVLNKNTGEIHDLTNEKLACKIDEIKPGNFFGCNSYEHALTLAKAIGVRNPNGCRFCLPEKNNG